MALIELRNASKVYRSEGAPVAALQNLSLEIERGDFVGIIGKSGCGKSTLLNLCGAMDFPTSGEVLISGQSTTSLSDAELTRLRRENIGFVFQSFQLIHTLSAVENVELPLLLARGNNSRATALSRLRAVDVDSLADRYPHQLSGGEQQRVAIARALALSPHVILADEPTGNLDSITGEIVLNLLMSAAREFGVAVMMATHNVESISSLDRVLRLRDGRLEEAVAFR